MSKYSLIKQEKENKSKRKELASSKNSEEAIEVLPENISTIVPHEKRQFFKKYNVNYYKMK